MTEAQAAFDAAAAPLCPAQLAAPALHRLLAHPQLLQLAWGAKGVGSQVSIGVYRLQMCRSLG